MKIQNHLSAPVDGVIERVSAQVGDLVEARQILVVVKHEEEATATDGS